MRKATISIIALAMMLVAGAAIASTPVFTDRNDISAAHLDGVDFAQANGIVSGYADGSFRPAVNISREQAASMFKNYNDAFPQVPGPAGADGADGVSGHEPLNTEQRVSDGSFEVTFDCPAGKVATGGGYELDGTANGSATNTSVTDNGPVFANSSAAGWRVAGDADGEVNVKVWALCANVG